MINLILMIFGLIDGLMGGTLINMGIALGVSLLGLLVFFTIFLLLTIRKVNIDIYISKIFNISKIFKTAFDTNMRDLNEKR